MLARELPRDIIVPLPMTRVRDDALTDEALTNNG